MKQQGIIQRNIDIAKSRYVPMQDILNYDLNVTNLLFEGNFTSKQDKHKLVLCMEKTYRKMTINFNTIPY